MTGVPTRPGGRRIGPKARGTARRLFETTTLTQVEIARRVGVLPASLSRMAKTNGWVRPNGKRAEVVRRVRTRIDEEIAAVEQVIAGAAGGGAGAETVDKAARALASLVRTLREIQKYDAEQARPDADDEDAPPQDLDALRATLAERLDRLRRGHA